MKPESENLTARESLDIIAAMIQAAKGNVQRNNFYFLFWGWVIVAANAGMYVLHQIDYKYYYAVWLITIPAWIVTFYKIWSQKREQTSTSHFDRTIGILWISFGVTIAVLILMGAKINFQLNAVILILSAIPTIVSGMILNFRPLMVGGATFWISGAICFLVDAQSQPLVGAIAIILGYLIPGYMLKNRKD